MGASARHPLHSLFVEPGEDIEFLTPQGEVRSGLTPEGAARVTLRACRLGAEPFQSNARRLVTRWLRVPAWDDVERMARDHGDAALHATLAAVIDGEIRSACGVNDPLAS